MLNKSSAVINAIGPRDLHASTDWLHCQIAPVRGTNSLFCVVKDSYADFWPPTVAMSQQPLKAICMSVILIALDVLDSLKTTIKAESPD